MCRINESHGWCRVNRVWAVLLALALQAGLCHAQDCPAMGRGLGQVWPDAARQMWEGHLIGPGLMPERWFRALRRADNGKPFAVRDSLARYGFRYCESTDSTDRANDPVGLAVAKDGSASAPIGLTCAACHSGELNDGKRRFVVQGGSAQVDLQHFAADLFAAVLLVRSGPFPDAQDSERWQDFAAAVLGKDHDVAASKHLHNEVSLWLQAQKAPQAGRHAGGDWGFGRQDRQSVIAARVRHALGTAALAPDAARAPVSVPALWGAPNRPRLTATGLETATGDGRSAFVRHGQTELGYAGWSDGATDATGELQALAVALGGLPAPNWPSEWGTIDRSSPDFTAGAKLYDQHCAQCHALAPDGAPLADATGLPLTPAPLGPDNPFLRVVPLDMMGTDPTRLCDEITDLTRSGSVVVPVADALTVASVAGPVPAGPAMPPVPTPGSRAARTAEAAIAACKPWLGPAAGYLATPLNGIFATAPYLHNGSVPTLDALLSPPDQRPKHFVAGGVLFDPVKVGLGRPIQKAPQSEFHAVDSSGAIIIGNSNLGHAFPAQPLNPVEKAQLILFLKSL